MFSSNSGQSNVVAGAVDQLFVAEQVRHCDGARRRHVRAVGHRDEGLDRLHARGDRLDQRQEGQVEEQDLVFGMVGDPDHLVGMQARVQRVQHGARARHRVVQLHVAVAVPGQRGDAVAEADAAALPARWPCGASAPRVRGRSCGACRPRRGAKRPPARRGGARHGSAARRSAAAAASSDPFIVSFAGMRA